MSLLRALLLCLLTGLLGPVFCHSQQSEPTATPLRRRILCLYGIDRSDPTRTPVWAADTFTNQMLQMALEWQGYIVDYHDTATSRPPGRLPEELYAGIILDSQLELPYAEEEWYLQWLQDHQKRGLKLLFIGGYPGERKELRLRLTESLGIRGSLDEILQAKGTRFDLLDTSVVDASLLTQPRTAGIIIAQAPEGARQILSLSCTDSRGLQLRSDAIYTADWGGALLEPYLFFRTSGEDVRLVIDPFVFLSRVFPPAQWPIPDITTRDGTRIFISHIDVDGFTTLTRTAKDITCAEVVRDQILKVYPFPVAVSVIEADTRALLKDQNPTDRQRYEDIARSLLALPHVQGASHSYSHPFVWMPEDKDSLRGYDTLNLTLADPQSYPTIQLEREIRGSVDYIQNQLMPPGKKMELFLWSGNCRPSGAALRMVQQLGLCAMNGGNTMISRRAQGIASISAQDTVTDGMQQVYAPVQNEYVYTGGFNGPLYGGYRLVLDTFQITETPRRLKPVCVYYHFYCAQTGDSLKSLKEVHDWCLAQPLHSQTGKQFVLSAQDARHAQLSSLGPQRWLYQSTGHCRTLRVPEQWGSPQLSSCQGITGYHTHQGQTYLHTSGDTRIIVDFTKPKAKNPTPPPLWLVTSTADIIIHKQSPTQLEASVSDFRPVTVLLAGLSPQRSYTVSGTARNQQIEQKNLTVDKSGRISLTLPPVSTFTVQQIPLQ
jgi:polysaccharide biosynthesis protein PelA